jgi:GNAT superfamily N-acetyltransferase
MPLEVSVASSRDAPYVSRLRDDLASWMLDNHIEQWRPGEMPLAWIEMLAEQQSLFVVRANEGVIASVTLLWSDPFIWGDEDESAGYVHMLMVDRAHRGEGLGRALLSWAEERIARSSRHFARLDCVRTNVALRSYYENAHYRLVRYRDFDEQASQALGGLTPAESALYEKHLAN